MKFNRTLSFDASRELVTSVSNGSDRRKPRASISKLDSERHSTAGGQWCLSSQKLQPLDPELAVTQEFSTSFVGLAGVFVPIKNDFTPTAQAGGGRQSGVNEDQDGEEADADADADEEEANGPRYSDAPHWPREKREKVKRVRFVICFLALIGVALAVMSRMMLNVAIVQMVKKPGAEEEANNMDTLSKSTSSAPLQSDEMDDLALSRDNLGSFVNNNDPLMFAATYEPSQAQDTTTTEACATSTGAQSSPATSGPTTRGNNSDAPDETDESGREDGAGPRFDWSKQDRNLILGSIYLGLIPGILLSGDLAQRYGAKYPLFSCVFGSALINILTPSIAGLSLELMIVSRILMGLLQGALLPSMYELFNRWLTKTESSIFAPLIKVSMPLGSVIGTYMPGLLSRNNLAWPLLFYFGGSLCLVWSSLWLLVATSMPQTNRFVEQSELNRIMRKKSAALKIIELPAPSQQVVVVVVEPSGEKGRRSLSKAVPQMDFQQRPPAATRRKTPWLKIVTNPSVLALMVTKFTYNIGIDFMILQSAVYLKDVHEAPMGTISDTLSVGYLLQMSLIVFVGWLAKTLVSRRALGLSVTKWRKVFQGGANFTMAACYLLLAYTEPGLELVAVLLVAICLFWMLGAGGESMIPYDMSSRFTAPIVGFSHSVSMTSGLALTAIVGVVVGESTQDGRRWSLLFAVLGSLLALGGLLLICILKAKPFLKAEMERAREQAASATTPVGQSVERKSTKIHKHPAE